MKIKNIDVKYILQFIVCKIFYVDDWYLMLLLLPVC